MILKDLGCDKECQLSLSIVGDRSIRRLNREYFEKDRPTNVISFSLQEGDFGTISTRALGDVVVSADTAAREADEAGIPFIDRLVFLILHGILHLCGYDHERSGKTEAERMEQKEGHIWNRIESSGILSGYRSL